MYKFILEKSKDPARTKLIEDFDNDEDIIFIKNLLKKVSIYQKNGVVSETTQNNYTNDYANFSHTKSEKECSLCSFSTLKNITKKWNKFIKTKYSTTHTTTHTTHTTHTTLTTLTTLFDKIDKSGIQGRNLELLLPLIFVASFVDSSDEFIDKIIKIAEDVTSARQHEEEVESFDVLMLRFIATLQQGIEYHSVRVLTSQFKNDFDLIDEEDINPRWFGRALKRLNLIKDKKRKNKGVEVLLNIPKAKEKSKMFETEEPKEEKVSKENIKPNNFFEKEVEKQ